MSSRLATLQQRRLALIERATRQRQTVRDLVAVWQGPVSVVDQVMDVVRRVSASPLTIPLGAVLSIWLRRWRWAVPLWSAWQMVSSFRRGRNRQTRTSR